MLDHPRSSRLLTRHPRCRQGAGFAPTTEVQSGTKVIKGYLQVQEWFVKSMILKHYKVIYSDADCSIIVVPVQVDGGAD